ncbi:hypothetical protein GW17_00025283 [Ensete ventricosum]|nr:hypothetical protein GW17_00025283 [Ensete ventricosum]
MRSCCIFAAKAARKGVAGHGQAPCRGGQPQPRSPAKGLPTATWTARKIDWPRPVHSQAVASLRQRLHARGSRPRLACDRAVEGGQQRQSPAGATPASTMPIGRSHAGRSYCLQGQPLAGRPAGAAPMEVPPVGAALTTKPAAPAPWQGYCRRARAVAARPVTTATT